MSGVRAQFHVHSEGFQVGREDTAKRRKTVICEGCGAAFERSVSAAKPKWCDECREKALKAAKKAWAGRNAYKPRERASIGTCSCGETFEIKRSGVAPTKCPSCRGKAATVRRRDQRSSAPEPPCSAGGSFDLGPMTRTKVNVDVARRGAAGSVGITGHKRSPFK